MVRHKNRYFILEVKQPNSNKTDLDSLNLRPYTLRKEIIAKVQQLHGDFGEAAILNGLIAKYCNEKTNMALLRVRHGPHRLVASSLPFITEMDSKPIKFNTLYIGATIRQCFKFLKNYQQSKFDKICTTLKTDEERAAMKQAILNFDLISEIR